MKALKPGGNVQQTRITSVSGVGGETLYSFKSTMVSGAAKCATIDALLATRPELSRPAAHLVRSELGGSEVGSGPGRSARLREEREAQEAAEDEAKRSRIAEQRRASIRLAATANTPAEPMKTSGGADEEETFDGFAPQADEAEGATTETAASPAPVFP